MSQYFLTTCYQSALSAAQIMPQRITNLLIFFYQFLLPQVSMCLSICLNRSKLDRSSSVNIKTYLSFFHCYLFLHSCFVICFSPLKGIRSLAKLSLHRVPHLVTEKYLVDYG